MKTFIRAIIVFLALSLPAGSFAMVNVEEEIKETKAQVYRTMAEVERAQKEADDVRGTADLLRTLAVSIKPPPYTSSEKVLVIPAVEIKSKDLITITEDMSVMARIFDKKLGQASSHSLLGDVPLFSSGTRGTRCIYLDGYGALFLMKVDFPLAPSPKVQEKEIEEEVDPLWEETKQEIYTPQDLRITTRRRRSERKKQYDAEKVEELKTKLIKALKHAANIRNLKPDESVILTVTAEGSKAGRGISRVIASTGHILVEDEDTKTTKIYTTPLSDEMGLSPTVMTIRAKKSDVDAFSKGNLDFDQFRKKVRIFTY